MPGGGSIRCSGLDGRLYFGFVGRRFDLGGHDGLFGLAGRGLFGGFGGFIIHHQLVLVAYIPIVIVFLMMKAMHEKKYRNPERGPMVPLAQFRKRHCQYLGHRRFPWVLVVGIDQPSYPPD